VKQGLKNSLYLTIANIITKIILIIGFVYIPNRLGVHDFGLYSAALSFVALFYIFGFEGIAKVIIRESIKDEDKLLEIFNNIFNFKVVIAILQVISIMIVALLIPSYNQELLIIIFIASNEALFKGLKTIPSSVIQAHEEIRILSKITVLHSFFRVVGMVAILFIINNLLIMMIYIACINIVFLFIYYKIMHKIIKIDLSLNFRKVKIPISIFKQSLVFTFIAVGSMLSTKIDVFMLSMMSSIEDVGVYSLSEKIIFQFEMLRGIILIAFYPIVIKHFKNGKAKLWTLFATTGVIFIGTLLMAILYSNYAESIINFLYADAYAQVAEISIVLFFYLVLVFSNLPFATAMQSVGLEKYILYMYPFSIGINIILNYYLFQDIGMIGLAYSTLSVQFFILFFLMIIGSYQLKKKGFV
jgi:O-antigen/teichoic acid export membrane protein